MTPPTTFHLVTRKTNEGPFLFQKFPEVCPPFGLSRLPPHYFMQRLKDFPPNLQDVVVVASTASADIGLFSRAKTPLTSDLPAEKITNVFTTTTPTDSRRAQLPMSESMEDTSPIGIATDLSAKEKVLRPLPGEEMDSSPGPVPALMVLNNEGLLSVWWIIYAESIRQGTTYPGMVSELSQGPHQSQGTAQLPAFCGTSGSESNIGQSALGAGASNGFGNVGAKNSSPSLFGGGNAPGPSSAFGAPSTTGASSSPWTSSGFSSVNANSGASSFGKPSFGSASAIGGSTATPAFGSTGGIGNRGSVWGGTPSGGPQTGGSVFGQSAGLGTGGGSTFGVPSTSGTFGTGATSSSSLAPAQGGFASFAKGPGFMSASSQGSGESPFAKAGTATSFGSTMDTDTPFGGTPQKKADTSSNFLSPGGFTLGSTFTKDDSGPPDLPKPTTSKQNSMFGEFGTALGEANKDVPQAESKEADMDDDDGDVAGSESSEEPPANSKTRTPTAKQVQSHGGIADTTTPKFGAMFGTQSHTKTTPAAVQSSTPTPSIFGRVPLSTTTPDETPQKQQESSPLTAQTPPSPSIKPEPEDQETPVGVSKSIPEAPLPPESTSKVSYAPGDSSNSSKSSRDAEDGPPLDWNPSKTKLRSVEKAPTGSPELSEDARGAPAPSDFAASKTKPETLQRQVNQEPPLPGDDGDDALDDEGSGVDVAQEVSPTSDPNQSPRITPGSSFGASFGPSPVSSMFSKPQPSRQSVKTLFGEVSQSSVPILPPPSRSQQSPRSPSPIRLAPPGDSLRPENARSISAPSRAPNAIAQQKTAKVLSGLTTPSLPSAQEQRRKEREALAARRSKQQAEEEQDLSDREDERVREELETEVEPTTILDEYLAHQDYVGGVTKPGIPGQIEKVYRDINSMVDTLGLNARALEGFIKGHLTMAKGDGRSLDDLEDPDWRLMEINDLVDLESSLQEQLDEGRVQDVQVKLNACRDMRKDLSKLRTRRTDIAKVLNSSPGEDEANASRHAPLSVEGAQKQHDLRKAYTKVQKLIAEAESNVVLLRASLASHDTSDSKAVPSKKPTVEAVTNTIRKMTSMVEKKSGDIDFLEAQMRKLRFSSINQDSREGSPLAAASPGMKSPLGKSLSAPAPSGVESPSNAMRRSTGESGTPRKRMSGVTPDELARYRTKMERRKEVNRIMHEAFAKAGPRTQSLD